jgi:hypothetical protein
MAKNMLRIEKVTAIQSFIRLRMGRPTVVYIQVFQFLHRSTAFFSLKKNGKKWETHTCSSKNDGNASDLYQTRRRIAADGSTTAGAAIEQTDLSATSAGDERVSKRLCLVLAVDHGKHVFTLIAIGLSNGRMRQDVVISSNKIINIQERRYCSTRQEHLRMTRQQGRMSWDRRDLQQLERWVARREAQSVGR